MKFSYLAIGGLAKRSVGYGIWTRFQKWTEDDTERNKTNLNFAN